jgi:hypothetical protein
MAYFLKFSDASGAFTTPDLVGFTLDQDVNGYDTLTVTLPPEITGIRQFQRVECFRADVGADFRIFSGYVFKVTAQLGQISVACNSEKWLLQKKLVLSDTAFSNTAANSAITSLVSAWNSAHGESWTVSCAVTDPITKTLKQGDDLFGVVEEIAGLVGCVFDAQDGVITVAPLLGRDLSAPGDGYAEAVYDELDPAGTNVSDLSVETYSTVTNVLISSDGTIKRTDVDAASKAQFGALGEYKEFRQGDLANQAGEYLASKKTEQKVITCQVSGLESVYKGDKIRLSIRNAGEYMDYEGTAIVNRKTLAIENGSERVTLGLADGYAYVDSLSKTLKQIQNSAFLNTL